MSEPLTIKTLGEAVAKTLDLHPGEGVEIARDRLDSNRVLVIRTPQEVLASVAKTVSASQQIYIPETQRAGSDVLITPSINRNRQ